MAGLIGAVALALIASTSVMNTGAMAWSCDDDSIDTVSDDGAIVTMNSGAVFRVESSGRSDTAFWHSCILGNDVLICRDETENHQQGSKRRTRQGVEYQLRVRPRRQFPPDHVAGRALFTADGLMGRFPPR
jgi:hypothetical protein